MLSTWSNLLLSSLYNKKADLCHWTLCELHEKEFFFFLSCTKLNGLFKFCININHSIENLINWSIKETWDVDCTPVQTAGWFNGCTIHPVFELAAHSIHTKLGYYPPWLPALFAIQPCFSTLIPIIRATKQHWMKGCGGAFRLGGPSFPINQIRRLLASLPHRHITTHSNKSNLHAALFETCADSV